MKMLDTWTLSQTLNQRRNPDSWLYGGHPKYPSVSDFCTMATSANIIEERENSQMNIIKIKKVIWNDDAVIVLWSDRTKTVVKRMESDDDDIYAAVAQALAKKIYGGTGSFHRHVNDVLKDYRTPTDIDKNFIMKSFQKLYKGIWWSSHPDGISTQN